MKLAVSAQGQDKASEVDPRFGRAKYFIIVDTEMGTYLPHDNAQNLEAAQGAGIQSARNIVNMGVDVVLTGNVGPKAFEALRACDIHVYVGASGTVLQAARAFQLGELQKAGEANVEEHWV